MPATRCRRLAPIPGAAVLIACVLLLSAESPDGSFLAAPSESAGGADALRDAIQNAFGHCDATPLDGAFSRRVKTYLASGGLGVRAGYYGADQARLMLRRGFAGRRTVRFRLGTPEDSGDMSGHRMILTARWLYRDPGGSKTEARLSLTLAREGPSWFIRELRELK